MVSLLARLDDLAAPLIEQITKHVGVTNYHAKVGSVMSNMVTLTAQKQ